jgi:DNA-binding GntR family transcriptional regulator
MTLLVEAGVLEKHAGRGFVVSSDGAKHPDPVRRLLSPSELSETPAGPGPALPVADTIKEEIEEAISTAIAFGHYRISEQDLADFHAVSRPVVREVLSRLKDVGLVEKQLHGSWRAGPLTAKAVSDDRELRTLIEPYALMVSAPYLAAAEIGAMRERLAQATEGSDKVEHTLYAAIEQDLHEKALQYFPNQRAWRVLREERLPLRINALFAQHVGIYANDPGLVEHRAILNCICSGDFSGAAASHARHLNNEGARTLGRLKVLSIVPDPVLPPYLQRIS